MGEYAKVGSELVKIGTCEDMYYLRADQIHKIKAEPCSLDPRLPNVQKHIRFRFPWPDEDHIAPGAFDKHDRALGLWNVKLPDELEHHTVQFRAEGYVVSLPCPEAPNAKHGLTVHRNGHPGIVQLVQQRFWEGKLVIVCQCGGCRAPYRLPTLEDAQPVIDEIRSQGAARGDFYMKIADRIVAGYNINQ